MRCDGDGDEVEDEEDKLDQAPGLTPSPDSVANASYAVTSPSRSLSSNPAMGTEERQTDDAYPMDRPRKRRASPDRSQEHRGSATGQRRLIRWR